MGHFTGHLDSIRHIGYTKAWPWGRAWLYLATNNADNPLTYRTNDGYIIELPRTVITDLASIPWPVSKYMPPAGGVETDKQWYRPAIFHDDWYQRNGVIMCGDGFIEKPRKWCDNRFFDMMVDCQVDKRTARIMHTAVDLLGQGPWEKHKGK
jgi:hypothetical protein